MVAGGRRTITCDGVEPWNELLINTPGYKVPRLDPWHFSIKNYLPKAIDPDKELQCSAGLHEYTWSTGSTILLRQDQLTEKKVKCCYRTILREDQSYDNYNNSADRLFQVGKECYPLNTSGTAVSTPGAFVTCSNDHGVEQYRNIHHLFNLGSHADKVKRWYGEGCLDVPAGIMERAEERKRETRSQNNADRKLPNLGKTRKNPDSRSDTYNVVLFGMDSVSKQNMIRYMPKTYNYLKSISAIDMQGYNKVGDNTFPNLMPVLVGKSGASVIKECLDNNLSNVIDKCPFIWKNFSKEGYVTVYGEDAPEMGLFHYKRTGFLKQPTDFYNRPSFMASEKFLGHSGKLGYKESYGHICQGPLLSFDVIKRYSLDAAKTLRCIPHFGFYWTTRVTHEENHLASLIDESAFEYVNLVRSRPEFSKTFVFFMSDHGMRFGKIRKTKIGKLEENLPFLFILLPSDFSERYSLAHKNLKKNQMRLTVPYDLHATLWDILFHQYQNETYLKEEGVISKSFPGISLFQQIPDTRTCDNAGVPVPYCASVSGIHSHISIKESENIAKFVVELLNKGLEKFPDCVQFTGHVVKIAERKDAAVSGSTVVQIQIQTYPGKAEMEATVDEKNGTLTLLGEVSRIDRYAGQSDCINDDIYRKYCFCKSLLTSQVS
ncbi:uncharacterized protein LOC143034539 isoform X2 [Oratosquilla oratoria]|uniref:uncharacterized protein LOC143034539 isoform X2 n=1 Tax=Oratosquilla oratoria TaxID=337810 RepID=UPI003F76EB53